MCDFYACPSRVCVTVSAGWKGRGVMKRRVGLVCLKKGSKRKCEPINEVRNCEECQTWAKDAEIREGDAR